MDKNPVDEIKQKLDITDIVGSYVQLKKAGKNYKGVCPFHSEKTPSFMVSPELQIFKCFGCGESGDIFSFVEKIEGVEFVDALQILAEKAGVKVENKNYDPNSRLKKQIYFINRTTTQFYNYMLLKHPAGKKGLEYLTKTRGIKLDTIKEWNLGYAPNNWDLLYRFLKSKGFNDEDLMASGVITHSRKGTIIDKFVGRIVFPFTEIDGKVVGFTGRTVFDREPKFLNTQETLVFNKSMYLYGLDKARVDIKTKGAVFVEGQMDVVSSHQSGIKNVIASSGTSLTEGQLKVLSRYTQDVAFCFDSDSAGVNAVYRAVEIAEKMNLNIMAIVIPDGYKDIDELLHKDKKEAKRIIEEPVPIYDYFLITLLKRHDKDSPYGKKRIAEELIPRYSRITNKVLYEHYAQKLAEVLGMSEEAIFTMMKKGQSQKTIEKIIEKETSDYFVRQSASSSERYLLALFLKANIDIIKDFMYKLEAGDIENSDIREIFDELVKYIQTNDKEFYPKSFEKKLKNDLKPIFTDLYMWDIGQLSEDPNKLVKELDNVIKRVRKKSIKKQLSSFTQRIKLAEGENNKGQLKDLTQQFNKLSQQLNINK